MAVITIRDLLNYLEGLPDDAPLVINIRPGDEYVQVEDITTIEGQAGRTSTGVDLTIISVLSGREIYNEIHRLRALARVRREAGLRVIVAVPLACH